MSIEGSYDQPPKIFLTPPQFFKCKTDNISYFWGMGIWRDTEEALQGGGNYKNS